MKDEEQVQQAMALFEYDPKWLEYSFIDENMLRHQWDIYQRGEDPHTEHYRYQAFRTVLANRTALDNIVVEHYITLVLLDPDTAMSRAALYDLVFFRGLTEQQIEYLAQRQEPMIRELMQKRHSVMVQRGLLNQVKSAESAEEVFELCLSSKDSLLQRALTDRTDLSREQWEILAANGVTRAIRNIARVRQERLERQKKRS